MPTSKFIPLPHLSYERVKPVSNEMPKLSGLDISVILERKNPVSGRYVAFHNLEKAVRDMYPNIFAQFTSKPQENVNPSPVEKIEKAPEVAPPPILVQATQSGESQKPALAEQASVAPSNVILMAEERAKREAAHVPPPEEIVKPDGNLDAEAIRRMVDQAYRAGDLKASAQNNQYVPKSQSSDIEQIGNYEDIQRKAA